MKTSPLQHKSQDPPRLPSCSRLSDPTSPADWICTAPPPGGTRGGRLIDRLSWSVGGLQTRMRHSKVHLRKWATVEAWRRGTRLLAGLDCELL